MSWGKWGLALAVVIVGLVVVEEVAPRAALPLVLIILLGVVMARPTFWPELLAVLGARPKES